MQNCLHWKAESEEQTDIALSPERYGHVLEDMVNVELILNFFMYLYKIAHKY